MASQSRSADPCSAGSVPYKEIGAALRLIFQRATQERLTGTEWRVLCAVASLTATYSKIWDKTYSAKIAELADLDRGDRHTAKTTRRTLKRLASLGLIQYEPARKHGEQTLVGLSLSVGSKESQ